MTHAFNEAVTKTVVSNGAVLRLPTQTEAIWRWLKDHPHRTTNEVAAATHIPESRVRAVVWQMHTERGMLDRRRGSRHGKGVWEYTALGNTYELLPKKANTPEGKAISAAVAERNLTLPPDESAALDKMLGIPAERPKFDIEVYTLGELRTIYAELKALFG